MLLTKGQLIPQRNTITDILDTKLLEILRSVSSGSCVLVDPDDISDNPQPITDVVELTADDTRLLVRLLLDVDSWFFARKQCLPKGTAIIGLRSRVGEAILLIGLSCVDWEIRIGSIRQCGFFDPVVDQVHGILKRAFPEIASSDSRSM